MRPRMREDDVRDVRRRHRKGETTTSLAKRFRVTVRAIQLIVSRQRWAWLR